MRMIAFDVIASSLPPNHDWFSEFQIKAGEILNPTINFNSCAGQTLVHLAGENPPASAEWYADLVTKARELENSRTTLRVLFDSLGQARKVRSDLKKVLTKRGIVKDKVYSIGPPGTEEPRAFVLQMPPLAEPEWQKEEVEEAIEEVEVAAQPMPVNDLSVGLGNFLVILVGATIDDQGTREFTDLVWKVEAGDGKEGGKYEDRVMTVPESDRARHLARALKTDVRTLRFNPQVLVGRKVFDRRRHSVKKSGQTEIANFYHPPEYAPTK